jgi:hypothetical protein
VRRTERQLPADVLEHLGVGHTPGTRRERHPADQPNDPVRPTRRNRRRYRRRPADLGSQVPCATCGTKSCRSADANSMVAPRSAER